MTTFKHELAKSTAQAKNLSVGVTPLYGVHTITTEADGDTVQLFKVDENQQVMMLRTRNEAMGALCTLQFGDGVDTDRYIKAFDASVADINDINNEAALIDGYPYPSGGDTVDMKIVGAAPTAGTKVIFQALLAYLPAV